jgi:hypothetical protein
VGVNSPQHQRLNKGISLDEVAMQFHTDTLLEEKPRVEMDAKTAIPCQSAKLVSFDVLGLSMEYHENVWDVDDSVMELCAFRDELWVLLASGLLLFLDAEKLTVKYSIELDTDGLVCQMFPVYNGHFAAVLCNERFSLLPTWLEQKTSKFSSVIINYPLAKCEHLCFAHVEHSGLFFTHSKDNKRMARFHITDLVVPDCDKILKIDSTRLISEVELEEKKKKEEDLKAYKQRKGLMLNLEDVNYTESSKPMGLVGMFDELEATSLDSLNVLINSKDAAESKEETKPPQAGRKTGFFPSPFRKKKNSSEQNSPGRKGSTK